MTGESKSNQEPARAVMPSGANDDEPPRSSHPNEHPSVIAAAFEAPSLARLFGRR